MIRPWPIILLYMDPRSHRIVKRSNKSVCLQMVIENLLPILCRLVRASLALRYIPHTWKLTRVVFIPKVGKDGCWDPNVLSPEGSQEDRVEMDHSLVRIF